MNRMVGVTPFSTGNRQEADRRILLDDRVEAVLKQAQHDWEGIEDDQTLHLPTQPQGWAFSVQGFKFNYVDRHCKNCK